MEKRQLIQEIRDKIKYFQENKSGGDYAIAISNLYIALSNLIQ